MSDEHLTLIGCMLFQSKSALDKESIDK